MKRDRSIRRSWAVLAVAAVAASLALVNASLSQAATGFAFTRYAGADRYDTAAKIATDTFATADFVIIASGETYPDALAASYVAGLPSGGLPILLVQRDAVPAPTSSALTALKTTKALIVGGTAAVSDTVAQALNAKGVATSRIAGTSRYETAQKLAESGGAKGTAIVASGEGFADALAAGPAAFAGALPVVLTASSSLSPEAKTALQDLGAKAVLIVGGTSAVSAATESQISSMGITVTRLAGNDRAGTAAAIGDFEVTNLGFSNKTVDLANGSTFPDALAGSTHGGKTKSALLLTLDRDTIGANTKAWLNKHGDTLTSGKIDGGTAAVSSTAESDATQAGTTPPSSTTTSSSSTTSTTAAPLPPCPSGQQGPGQPFCTSSAATAQPGPPKFKTVAATASSTSSTITLTYTEPVACGSVDANGTDYAVTVTRGTSTATVAVSAQPSCSSAGPSQSSTTVTLTGPPSGTGTGTINAGDTVTVTAKAGGDGDTVKDTDTPTPSVQAVGDSMSTTVPSGGPKLISGSAGNNSVTIVLTYDQALSPQTCPSGVKSTDYTVLLNTATGPSVTSATCAPGGSTVTLTLGGPVTTGQQLKVTYNSNGTGDVKNATGSSELDGDSITFAVS